VHARRRRMSCKCAHTHIEKSILHIIAIGLNERERPRSLLAERNYIFRPGVLIQPELFSALDHHFLFCKLSNRFLYEREPRVANFFTPSPNYVLFFVRSGVYSYAAPSPHSWPSAQVECIKFKHSLIQKIACGVSRLCAGGDMRLFALFLLVCRIRTCEKQTHHHSLTSVGLNYFHDL
jgi:hypothetical protein